MSNTKSKSSRPPDMPVQNENRYSMWVSDDSSEKKSLRASIVVAVVLHALLLAVTFPALSTPDLDQDKEERTVFLLETPRFKQPPEYPTPPIPKKRVKKIPIPDPDPDGPDLYVVDEEPEIEIDLDSYDANLPLRIPEAPPMPEPPKDIYRVGEIENPERIHYVAPLYTEIARRARVEGVVRLQAIINKHGNVTDLKVMKALTMGLTEEALKAVRQWRYKPSTVDGRPVNVLLTVTVRFKLQ